MKIVSSLITILLTLLCVVFAVNNRQEIALNLWPADYTLNAPVYLITLGGLFIGFFCGALLFWLFSLHPRWQRHSLAKETERLKAALIEERAKNTSTAVTPFEG